VASDPKIRFFLIVTALAVFLSSCNKNNDVIPDCPVDFTLNLNDPEFAHLSAISSYVIVTSKTNNWGSSAAGFDNNGIIVYRAQDIGFPPEFYAYDRTCPHDYTVNGLSIKINIDFIKAVCPQCSTVYSLQIGGIPSSGPGRYPLKNYKTSFNGQYLRVWNN
jgi:hypothetical protein